MRYSAIRSCDINNGEGLMVTLWTQGCHFHCDKCHNPDLQNFEGGKEFTNQSIDKIIELLNSPQNLAILGGEPLEELNLKKLKELVSKVKEIYPNKKIWLWTGHVWESIKDYELLKYIDVLIDGQFVFNLYSKDLKYRGSSNQRVIDVQESLKENKLILSKYN